MFKALGNKRGQGVTVQYVLTFFLVVAIVTAMSVYVRRAIQARIRDANVYLFSTVNAVYSDRSQNIQGVYYGQYEPYYINQESDQYTKSGETQQEFAGPAGTSGIYQKKVNDTTSAQSVSQQARPGLSN